LGRLLVKSTGMENDITPCFMAKPVFGLAGSSGHIHISLVDSAGKNAFARDTPDPEAQWKDIECLSDTGRHFLAGLLTALPDLMPLFAPTVNSYKRLVENYWAPTTLGWGLEDRTSSVRLIAPPVSKPGATRFEIRIPGADLHPHYSLAALLGAGWRGVKDQLEIPVPPTMLRKDKLQPLPDTLETATARFRAPESVARQIFSADFVDLYAHSRDHEVRLYKQAVTDW
jgi:glutamine synthetase